MFQSVVLTLQGLFRTYLGLELKIRTSGVIFNRWRSSDHVFTSYYTNDSVSRAKKLARNGMCALYMQSDSHAKEEKRPWIDRLQVPP